VEAVTYSKRRLWKWKLAALLLVVCILLANSVNHAIFAVRLAFSLQKLAQGSTALNSDIQESKIHRQAGPQSFNALVYSPAKSSAKTAVVLVAGLSEQGCYHPRLIALSKLLASRGLLVITPDIQEFRDFQITAEPVDQIQFWFREVPKLEWGQTVQKTGLAGISYSGTLALIAAAKPEIRDTVGFVAGIGPYSSLIRCTRGWFAPGPVTVGDDYYPTRFYAKWIVMRSALGMIASESDRVFLHKVLDDLLLQKKVSPIPPDLTAEGERWYALATMRENQSDPELSMQIERYLVANIFPQLDPGEALTRLKCPTFLIHGAYDDLIPSEESVELHRRLPHSFLLISPFLTHTHPTDKPSSFSRKAKAALDTIVFCYQFARVIS
jgi:pimeloyl-ACP methyl ester carboxylesterase